MEFPEPDDISESGVPEEPEMVQDKEQVFTPGALEATQKADEELEALDEIADFYTEHFDDIADGKVTTGDLWRNNNDRFQLAAGAPKMKGVDLSQIQSPYTADHIQKFDLEGDFSLDASQLDNLDTGVDATIAQGMLGLVNGPRPGDLDWQPSDTGVQYPNPETKEGSAGGPERLRVKNDLDESRATPDLADQQDSGDIGQDQGRETLQTGDGQDPANQPGELHYQPNSTGVQYPDPERKEGNVGGPERLG